MPRPSCPVDDHTQQDKRGTQRDSVPSIRQQPDQRWRV